MRIVAVADVHSPKYLEEFRESLSRIDRPDMFLMAGDMVNFGKSAEYRNIIDAIDSFLGMEVPVIACFGNEEFRDSRTSILELTRRRITFLDGASLTIERKGYRIGIVGAPAPTDILDAAQSVNHQDIRRVFDSRAKLLATLVRDISWEVDSTILLMHYSPLGESIDDEEPNKYSWWISKVIKDTKPDLVVHGHLHNPKTREVLIGDTRVINSAFPASMELTEILPRFF
ncbi:MAG: metallophosphoesterase family protein [Candidatus Thorarchaeota archaeon]|jgi:Icc-related predicted phosphoesterase